MQTARPLDEWIAQPGTHPPCARACTGPARPRLCETELHLPDNASYRRYADLEAPRRRVERSGCTAGCPHAAHLVLSGDGCIGYRGYFDQADAQAEADRLAAQGWRWTCTACPPTPRWAT